MSRINRRAALSLGAALAGGAIALAKGDQGNAAQPSPGSVQNSAVLFWNEVALKLNALDHSFTGDNAADLPRAPGPVASARALGVIHAVIADALFTVDSSSGFKPHFVTGIVPGEDKDVNKDLFVGGAAAAIMFYIYDTGSHAVLIKDSENEFIPKFPGLYDGVKNKRSWEAGRLFGNHPDFQALFDGPEILRTIHPTNIKDYQPAPKLHQPDPYHCGQGFYGQIYAREIDPIIITREDVEKTFLPPEPPTATSDKWKDSLKDVKKAGQLYLKPNGGTDQPEYATDQLEVGYFWAYDGPRFLGTPPRLYNQIIREIAIADGMEEAWIARLLALCNLAMSDAGNVAWHAKYHFKVPRPVIGIREAPQAEGGDLTWRPLGAPRTNNRLPGAGIAFIASATSNDAAPFVEKAAAAATSSLVTLQNTTVQDIFLGSGLGGARVASAGGVGCELNPDLNYVLGAFTPNFPAYPSGHATFGAAAFDVLRLVRHERKPTADANVLPVIDGVQIKHMSDELNGASIDNLRSSAREFIWREFATIGDIIKANNRSRVVLGVHWDFDSTAGAAAGKQVADKVFKMAYKK
ncbi:hypothetical protein [Mesorhizobium sp. M0435]|uniref:vanadium-dependent haloperoxidase n=1 Tax=unclassified Mesorhizobium TaxID=325217 RepID=UPI00333D914B